MAEVEVTNIEDPRLRCPICGGPIGTGEPIIMTDAGIAHRFATDCEWHRKQIN